MIHFVSSSSMRSNIDPPYEAQNPFESPFEESAEKDK